VIVEFDGKPGSSDSAELPLLVARSGVGKTQREGRP
jgi:hypothetical protein